MRVLSGIQPTGEMHIGNYLGAAKQWVEIQEKHESLFMVADLHALTVSQNPKNLRKAILNKVIELLSVGLTPEKCTIFIQSHVKEHAELAWIFNTITPLADLQRMTQYKEKSKKHKKNINAGLLTYPVLMAADILLYQTDIVPVGKDQQQHVELTRDIARRFNLNFGTAFKIPKTILAKSGAKIMSLQDPKKKMSKSDNPKTYIGLFEEPKMIRKKIMAAVTDRGKQIIYNPQKKPGISNLLTIYSLFSGKTIKSLEKDFQHEKGYAGFKKSLAELLISSLEPLRRKRKELLKREVYVREVLKQGKKKAELIAKSTTQDVKEKMGLI
ncbi:MAG: tryptophan--tRNA ligase [Patescibacteria group bacterium]|nr:tryptophan--tRNA ligase [Patescibacteria group bacterium]